METIGLRYFNVFGPRQDPNGAYAAVIPKWFSALLSREPVYINGDGETSRDFCYIENCIQANILAAITQKGDAVNEVYNVSGGKRISLCQLFLTIKEIVVRKFPSAADTQPIYREFRMGDVRHSMADISKATTKISYAPACDVSQGLEKAYCWYASSIDSGGSGHIAGGSQGIRELPVMDSEEALGRRAQ
jgi:UDP-N-acetylglucosamine 4-epimerase